MLKTNTKYFVKNHPIELEWDFSAIAGLFIYSLNSSRWKILNFRITKKRNNIIIFQNSDIIDFNLYRISWFRIKKMSVFHISPKAIDLVSTKVDVKEINAPTIDFKVLSARKNPIFIKANGDIGQFHFTKISTFNLTINTFTYHE